MKRNFFSRLDKIESALKKIGDSYLIEFTSGETLQMTDKRIRRMFESIHAGEPNKDVQFFLNQLKNGYKDAGGLVYLIDAENIRNEPERIAEIWGR